MNVAFAPEKLKPPTSLQISYVTNGSTRHIYVYHDSPEVIVEWYMAIRSAKLNLLQVAHPTASEAEVLYLYFSFFCRLCILLLLFEVPI